MQGAARNHAGRTQRVPTGRPAERSRNPRLDASRTRLRPADLRRYGRSVATVRGGAASEVERALAAFLAFRNADMDLWRRASLVAKLSHSSMLALALILRADAAGDPLRQVAVQTLLRISPAGTSAIVSELAERGLVRRQADPADGRAFLLVGGEAAPMVAEQLRQHDDEFRELVADVPAEHLLSLVQVLDGMRALNERKYLDA